MKHGERGFTLIEVAVAVAIIALIGSAAAATTFQVFTGTERSNNHTAAVRQVQNAGYWMTRDAQIAESATAEGLEFPNFLTLAWAEQNYEEGDTTYHLVTYFFEDLTDTFGTLKRIHWSSAGANEQTLVAKNIYYNPADPAYTSKASYERPVLTVQLTAILGDAKETKEYKAQHRPNL